MTEITHAVHPPLFLTSSSKQLPPFLSIGDLAELLGVSPRTIEDWRRKRIGPPVTKVGRHVRFRREAVEEWLAFRTESRS